eukprot:UN07379
MYKQCSCVTSDIIMVIISFMYEWFTTSSYP